MCTDPSWPDVISLDKQGIRHTTFSSALTWAVVLQINVLQETTNDVSGAGYSERMGVHSEN